MFEPSEYELLDFGAGRKLERFGTEILDRPSPSAERSKIANRDLWTTASARFVMGRSGKGEWTGAERLPSPDSREPWSVRHGRSRLLMQPKASGNVGIFPEQVHNWEWIATQVEQCIETLATGRPRVLNLFAYTGGASLAAAHAGAEVTHVDSSAPTVAWAKRNAAGSGMSELPIRWLVEDAMKFLSRESRRGNFYDGVIADPPTYGHGPKGKPFKFTQHLEELMELSGQLLRAPGDHHRFLLFSCHVPGFGPEDAVSSVSGAGLDVDQAQVAGRPLVLETTDGRTLPAGVSARWSTSART